MPTTAFEFGITGNRPSDAIALPAVLLPTSESECESSPLQRQARCGQNKIRTRDAKLSFDDSLFNVAAFIIESLDGLSVSKLQLLLYYCQAWALVWDDVVAFPDPIIAGPNGPYIARIQETFRGLFSIKSYAFGASENIDAGVKETCKVVIEHYGKYSAQELIFLSESESPWKLAREKSVAGSNPVIQLDEMMTFYRSLLQRNEQK